MQRVLPNREGKGKIVYGILIIFIIGILIGSSFLFFYSPYKFGGDGPIKIFILNSYHEDFPEGNLVGKYIDGFYDALEDVDFEIRRFDMDVLRKNSDELREVAAMEAKKEIDEYSPDLIFATDDDAQKLVIEPYYINSDFQVVFTSLAKDPTDYGYVGSKNIAGILEREHFGSAIEYLRELFPHVKKIAVISESHPRWSNSIGRMKEKQDEVPETEFVGWHSVGEFEEFKDLVLGYQNQVDAFLFTPLDNLADGSGNKVLLVDVIKWLTENSNLPEVSLWPTPNEGMLAAVSYSPYEQGKAAGKLVQKILIDGEKPSSLEFKSTEIGDQYINLARAKTLGIEKNDISSTILVNSIIVYNFPWENKSEVDK